MENVAVEVTLMHSVATRPIPDEVYAMFADFLHDFTERSGQTKTAALASTAMLSIKRTSPPY